MQITTREDVLACFRLLLGRELSAAENAGHLAFVGTPLESVVSAYLQSLEFRNRGLLQPSTEAEVVEPQRLSIYVAKDDALIAPGIRAGYEPEVTRVFLEPWHAALLWILEQTAGITRFWRRRGACMLMRLSHSRETCAYYTQACC
jgi:hypothetical protein